MKSKAVIALSVFLVGASADAAAPVRPVTDSYFGTAVVDPYRYMESAKDPDYIAWRSTQLAATRAMLAKVRGPASLAPHAAVPAKLSSLTVVNGSMFFVKTTSDGDALVVRRLGAGARDHTIVTGARFSSSKGRGSLGAFAVSPDAKMVAIHTYAGGIVVSDIHVLRVADGADVEPPIPGTIYDYVDFTQDGKRIYYARGAQKITQMAVPDAAYDYSHVIGSSQRGDVVIFGPKVSKLVPMPPRAFAFVDPGGSKYALAEVRDVAAGGSRFYVAPSASVGKPDTPWRPLGSVADRYTDYAVHGDTIDLTTSAGAPNFKVVRASLAGAFAPRTIVPASASVVVSGTLDGIPKAGIFALYPAKDADYVQLLDGGASRLVRVPYAADARPQAVPLPYAGSILQVATDPGMPGAVFETTSWTESGDVYAFDPQTGATTALRVKAPARDPARVADVLTAKAPDGTDVAISVVYRRGLVMDGKRPVMLRVAGAYGFSTTPDYSRAPEEWLAGGGIYAVAHVRGGGERGEAWHRAGMGMLKSNSWNDLIAAAQRMIDAGYTSPKRIGLYGTTQSYLGGIASSIAIGRALEERPDLFAAAVVDVPVFDMLRSEKTQLGRQSLSEFGSTATREGFEALLAMSPYAHVKDGVAYPPLLARSLAPIGLGDDWQAAKMVARLQAAAGRNDVAYLDVLGDSPDDKRGRAEFNREAMAFLSAAQPSP
jgi:prolyl oligopeptidase